ncbi:MAG: 23S rRNA (adenine(2503)-C(2))-methyltransferase RlmN [bacterium]
MHFLEFVNKIEPKFRGKQLRQAVFKELIDNFDDITTISKSDREKYAESTEIVPFVVKKVEESDDGSVKWLLESSTKNPFETVLMRFRDGRNTVCISSQSGCSVGCAFCATGKLGFKSNLNTWEIVSQVLLAARYLRQIQNQKGGSVAGLADEHITNVVFMGMGEPLLNMNNVLGAIELITSPDGFGLGARHVTVSTVGPIENLKKFIAANTRTTLAISLHAPDQYLREKLTPIAKGNSLESLFQTLDKYVDDSGRRVTYEYVLLKGVNDRIKDAHDLGTLLKGRLAHVNLINFNPVEGIEFQLSMRRDVDRFKEIVETYGVTVTKRVSLGSEISAACGQLAAGKNTEVY